MLKSYIRKTNVTTSIVIETSEENGDPLLEEYFKVAQHVWRNIYLINIPTYLGLVLGDASCLDERVYLGRYLPTVG